MTKTDGFRVWAALSAALAVSLLALISVRSAEAAFNVETTPFCGSLRKGGARG